MTSKVLRQMKGPPETLNGMPVPYGTTLSELVRQVESPGPQAWAAIMAIGHTGTSSALDVLLRFLNHADWRYRRSAVEAIAYHPLAHTAAPQIIGALSDNSPFVVRTAASAVSDLGLSEAHDLLLGLMTAPEAATRQSVVLAISKLWSISDFHAMFELFRADPDQSVRRAAGWALYENRSSDNWELLFSTWLTDSLPRHRVWACVLAQEFGNAAHRSQLIPLLDDPDGHVRKAATQVIVISE